MGRVPCSKGCYEGSSLDRGSRKEENLRLEPKRMLICALHLSACMRLPG